MRLYLAGPLFTPYERGFIAEYGARLRAEGYECFIPHEHSLKTDDLSARAVFEKDGEGLFRAHAVVALLDGPMIDDGTACEIGLFYGLMQQDQNRKGVVGLLTDSRQDRVRENMEGKGLNLYVLGCIEATGGRVVQTIDEILPILATWRQELEEAGST
ncbi:MAG: hypothetical protein C7B45_03825 [Sulfobacillus acidophilus]|uniref:Nucleoside 2-deoxyribosyltransferase n=1 Tax=Sulfobacillus acidophilus TaxID=53633 RepID=A0A2T2WLW9_9FIRM|nr:MAG: hypothetical protein C7B45_03825 [Sulfobacillus acidophilus]